VPCGFLCLPARLSTCPPACPPCRRLHPHACLQRADSWVLSNIRTQARLLQAQEKKAEEELRAKFVPRADAGVWGNGTLPVRSTAAPLFATAAAAIRISSSSGQPGSKALALEDVLPLDDGL
jgi:hypothetical protein